MNYPEYLKVNELLTLQQPKSGEHDEMLFILIHQTYLLGFSTPAAFYKAFKRWAGTTPKHYRQQYINK